MSPPAVDPVPFLNQMFVLPEDLTNPRPNRSHRHDWRKAPVFKGGTRFTVVLLHGSRSPVTVIVRFGEYTSQSLDTEGEQGQALLAALRPAAVSSVDDVVGLSRALSRDVRAHEILQHLVDISVISLDDVILAEENLHSMEKSGL